MEVKETNDLESQLSSGTKISEQSKPIFFNLADEADREVLSRLFEEQKIQHVRDVYEAQQLEVLKA